jgi:hypothetical protein
MRIKGFPGRSVKSAEGGGGGQARRGQRRQQREKGERGGGENEDEIGNERTGPVGGEGRLTEGKETFINLLRLDLFFFISAGVL